MGQHHFCFRHQARHRGYTAVRHKCHLHLHETCGLEGKRNIKGISQQLNIIVIRCHEGDSDKKSSMARNRWQWHLSRIDQTPGTKKKSEAAAVCRGAGEPVMEEFHGKNSEAREILRQEGEFKLRLNGNILKRFKRFRRNESWRPSIIQLGSGSTFLFLFFCSKTLNISANLGNR
ncbi:uncharacterized protein LOC105726151 isoform X4 [Aotus nancymaae]|uniref:uncharacterized protein LOC105726151 isoform X4 n=1 Tax=Aotus nancymaae TaxID=37293 RepID=UPI0030FF3CDA